MKPRGCPAGPEGRSGGRSGGPRAQPGTLEVSTFFFRVSWIPTMVFKFYRQNLREYRQKFQKKWWNPGHKIKKICAVSIEIFLWWYLGQEYSCSHCYPLSIHIYLCVLAFKFSLSTIMAEKIISDIDFSFPIQLLTSCCSISFQKC